MRNPQRPLYRQYYKRNRTGAEAVTLSKLLHNFRADSGKGVVGAYSVGAEEHQGAVIEGKDEVFQLCPSVVIPATGTAEAVDGAEQGGIEADKLLAVGGGGAIKA